MKNVTGIIAILVIVGSAIWLMYSEKSKPAPGEPAPTMMPLVCDSCEHVWKQMTGGLPTKCEECGEKTAYRGQQCGDCGRVFPYPDWGKPKAGHSGAACKYCQSTNVGEVRSDAIP